MQHTRRWHRVVCACKIKSWWSAGDLLARRSIVRQLPKHIFLMTCSWLSMLR